MVVWRLCFTAGQMRASGSAHVEFSERTEWSEVGGELYLQHQGGQWPDLIFGFGLIPSVMNSTFTFGTGAVLI